MSMNENGLPEYSLENARQEIVFADKNMARLMEYLAVCPAVDSSGHSTHPDAEAIYRKKEELASFCRDSHEILCALQDAARRTVGELQDKHRELSRDDPEYPEIEGELRRHQLMAEALYKKEQHVKQALADSDRKRFPGMKHWT